MGQQTRGGEAGPRRFELIASYIAAFILIGMSLYFFMLSVSLMSQSTPRVTAGLLSLIIGFASLSASVSILRTALLSRSAALILSKEEGRKK